MLLHFFVLGEFMSQEDQRHGDQAGSLGKESGKGHDKISLQVQTPRGLWSETSPPQATLRPIYPPSTKIEQVIVDARTVFKFTEADNKYVLLLGQERLEPQRTIVSYHLKDGTLLVLSVQGGNA
jgi:hypothetical protein